MKRLKKSLSDQRQPVSSLNRAVSMARWGLNPVKLMSFFVVGLIVLTAASVILRDLPSHTRLRLLAEPTLFHIKQPSNGTLFSLSFIIFSPIFPNITCDSVILIILLQIDYYCLVDNWFICRWKESPSTFSVSPYVLVLGMKMNTK